MLILRTLICERFERCQSANNIAANGLAVGRQQEVYASLKSCNDCVVRLQHASIMNVLVKHSITSDTIVNEYLVYRQIEQFVMFMVLKPSS